MDYRVELTKILQQDYLSITSDLRAKGFVVDDPHDEAVYIKDIDTSFQVDSVAALESLSRVIVSHTCSASVAAGFVAAVPPAMRLLPNCEIVMHVEWLHSTSTYTRGSLEGEWHEVPARRRIPFPTFFPVRRYAPICVGEA